jgi:MYXO-CTERM domain-containing protein
MRSSSRVLFAGAILVLSARPEPARACGGLFCSGPQAPVIQTGESIVFAVDRPNGTVTAIINIRYSGPASSFAWLLPLQAAPEEIDVAPSSVFVNVDRLTAPQFQISRFEQNGVCSRDRLEIGLFEEDAIFKAAEPPPVQVLSEQQVGPYESVVLDSQDADRVRAWLVDHDYQVTDQMMDAVTPYIAKGDALLALRLEKDRTTGDIQPISLKMRGNEVCVPIRLTAIAAQADMDITALVLSNEGRAIPENYYHVSLNLARIDWARQGANYRQLVSQAADEGEGNAFTTEFSGSTLIFAGQIHPPFRYDRTVLERARYFSEYNQIASVQFFGMPEANAILAPYQNGTKPFDARAITDELWRRIVEPEKKVQGLFDRFSTVTRLYTLISPEEMTLDPTFTFRDDLPEVSNVHRAIARLDCGLGGTSGGASGELEILETGQRVPFSFDGSQQVTLDAMPAAALVEQLAMGIQVRDNRETIADFLAAQSGCGCAASRGDRSSLVLLAALGTLFVLRRRR